MDDQLRPVETPVSHELNALSEAAICIGLSRGAFNDNSPIEGRLQALKAANLLRSVVSGEAV